jgi:hypothetical protein
MNTSIANLIFAVIFVGFFAYFFTRQSITAPPPSPDPEPMPQVIHDTLPHIHDQVPEEVEIIE